MGSSDFLVLPNLKKIQTEKLFKLNKEVVATVNGYFEDLSELYFKNLIKLSEKVLKIKGDCQAQNFSLCPHRTALKIGENQQSKIPSNVSRYHFTWQTGSKLICDSPENSSISKEIMWHKKSDLIY